MWICFFVAVLIHLMVIRACYLLFRISKNRVSDDIWVEQRKGPFRTMVIIGSGKKNNNKKKQTETLLVSAETCKQIQAVLKIGLSCTSAVNSPQRISPSVWASNTAKHNIQ